MTITIREFSTISVAPAADACELILHGERQELLDLLASIVKPPEVADYIIGAKPEEAPVPTLGRFKVGDKVRFKDAHHGYVSAHIQEGVGLSKALGTLTVAEFGVGRTVRFKEIDLWSYTHRLEHVVEKPGVQYVVQDTSDNTLAVFGKGCFGGYYYIYPQSSLKKQATRFDTLKAAGAAVHKCDRGHLLRSDRWVIKPIDEIIGWD